MGTITKQALYYLLIHPYLPPWSVPNRGLQGNVGPLNKGIWVLALQGGRIWPVRAFDNACAPLRVYNV